VPSFGDSEVRGYLERARPAHVDGLNLIEIDTIAVSYEFASPRRAVQLRVKFEPTRELRSVEPEQPSVSRSQDRAHSICGAVRFIGNDEYRPAPADHGEKSGWLNSSLSSSRVPSYPLVVWALLTFLWVPVHDR